MPILKERPRSFVRACVRWPPGQASLPEHEGLWTSFLASRCTYINKDAVPSLSSNEFRLAPSTRNTNWRSAQASQQVSYFSMPAGVSGSNGLSWLSCRAHRDVGMCRVLGRACSAPGRAIVCFPLKGIRVQGQAFQRSAIPFATVEGLVAMMLPASMMILMILMMMMTLIRGVNRSTVYGVRFACTLLAPYSPDHTCFLHGRHKRKERQKEVGQRSPTVELQGPFGLLHIVNIRVGLYTRYAHYALLYWECCRQPSSVTSRESTQCKGRCKSTVLCLTGLHKSSRLWLFEASSVLLRYLGPCCML